MRYLWKHHISKIILAWLLMPIWAVVYKAIPNSLSSLSVTIIVFYPFINIMVMLTRFALDRINPDEANEPILKQLKIVHKDYCKFRNTLFNIFGVTHNKPLYVDQRGRFLFCREHSIATSLEAYKSRIKLRCSKVKVRDHEQTEYIDIFSCVLFGSFAGNKYIELNCKLFHDKVNRRIDIESIDDITLYGYNICYTVKHFRDFHPYVASTLLALCFTLDYSYKNLLKSLERH